MNSERDEVNEMATLQKAFKEAVDFVNFIRYYNDEQYR